MKYDCIVIGSGASGLTVSLGLVGAGKKVLLVERANSGGECTWGGCVPSKSLIALSKKNLGVRKTLEEVRARRQMVADEETPEILRKRGVEYINGTAKFVNEKSISIDGVIYEGKDIVIATGSRPFIPPIQGLDSVEYLTNENIFEQEILPDKMVMIGAGVISLELSFALKRMGIDITILEVGDRLLPMEDEVISEFYKKQLDNAGIKLILKCGDIKIFKNEKGADIEYQNGKVFCKKIFISTGRAPNIEDLELEKAGIEYNKKGILVDETLQTSVKNIYAVGDVVGPYRFSHMAGYHGETVVRNILFPYVKKKVNYTSIPWVIFSNPEFARIGLNEKEAKDKKEEIKVYTLSSEKNERSIISLENEFLLKVICDKKYKIIGGYCIGERAGEIMGILQFMHSQDMHFYKLVESIQAYPTYTDSLRKLAKQAYAEHLREMFSFTRS